MRQLSCKNDLSAFGATLGKLGQLYIPSSGHTGLVSTGFLNTEDCLNAFLASFWKSSAKS